MADGAPSPRVLLLAMVPAFGMVINTEAPVVVEFGFDT